MSTGFHPRINRRKIVIVDHYTTIRKNVIMDHCTIIIRNDIFAFQKGVFPIEYGKGTSGISFAIV